MWPNWCSIFGQRLFEVRSCSIFVCDKIIILSDDFVAIKNKDVAKVKKTMASHVRSKSFNVWDDISEA